MLYMKFNKIIFVFLCVEMSSGVIFGSEEVKKAFVQELIRRVTEESEKQAVHSEQKWNSPEEEKQAVIQEHMRRIAEAEKRESERQAQALEQKPQSWREWAGSCVASAKEKVGKLFNRLFSTPIQQQ